MKLNLEFKTTSNVHGEIDFSAAVDFSSEHFETFNDKVVNVWISFVCLLFFFQCYENVMPVSNIMNKIDVQSYQGFETKEFYFNGKTRLNKFSYKGFDFETLNVSFLFAQFFN